MICAEVSELMKSTNQYRCIDMIELFCYRHTMEHLFDIDIFVKP